MNFLPQTARNNKINRTPKLIYWLAHLHFSTSADFHTFTPRITFLSLHRTLYFITFLRLAIFTQQTFFITIIIALFCPLLFYTMHTFQIHAFAYHSNSFYLIIIIIYHYHLRPCFSAKKCNLFKKTLDFSKNVVL